MVGAPSPAEKLSPAGLRRSSKCHTCCPLSSFWVSLSTHPQVIQRRTALGRGPLLSPRAAKGWALALLQLLGARRGKNQRQAMWAPTFISQLQRQTNPVPMPGTAAARCLWPQPVLPHLLLFPRRKTGPQAWSQGAQRALTTGGVSSVRQGPLCS